MYYMTTKDPITICCPVRMKLFGQSTKLDTTMYYITMQGIGLDINALLKDDKRGHSVYIVEAFQFTNHDVIHVPFQ